MIILEIEGTPFSGQATFKASTSLGVPTLVHVWFPRLSPVSSVPGPLERKLRGLAVIWTSISHSISKAMALGVPIL